MLENLPILPLEIPNASEIQESQPIKGEPYLCFYLASGTKFALSAAGIKEVMQQPVDRIASVPNASPLLLGAINFRGQVIWVADLGKFLGDKAELGEECGEIPTIIIENQDTILALAVGALGEMEWLDAGQLRASINLPDATAAYVQGEWAIEGNSQQVLRLLDHSVILRSARWAA